MFDLYKTMVDHLDQPKPNAILVAKPDKFMARSAIRCYAWASTLGQNKFEKVFSDFGNKTTRWAEKFAALFLLPRIGKDAKLGADGVLRFDVKKEQMMPQINQICSFHLLQIFHKYETGEKVEVALYQKFDEKHWAILLAYNDVWRTVVIPEWNKQFPEYKLRYDHKLLKWGLANLDDIIRKKDVKVKDAGLSPMIEAIIVKAYELIGNDTDHPMWTKEYAEMLVKYEKDWK